MNREQKRYQVNLLHPKKGQMRDEVLVILVVLVAWGVGTFGFQLLVAACRGTGAGSLLTRLSFFNLPLHFWFTGQLLPLWFIGLCVAFNLYIDRISETHGRRISETHSRRRDRSYE